MKLYTVYYTFPEHFSRFNFGGEFPTVEEMELTHKKVRSFEAVDLDDVFYEMQGEVWSPNGEKYDLIKLLGVGHTSMSVGDVIHDVNADKRYVVAPIGFKEIN